MMEFRALSSAVTSTCSPSLYRASAPPARTYTRLALRNSHSISTHRNRPARLFTATQSRPLSNMPAIVTNMASIEDAKRSAALVAVKNHYPPNPRFVGIGSGSTIAYVVEAIKTLKIDTTRTMFVPTGFQSNQLIVKAGLLPIAFDSLPEGVLIDVAFDGADEVDEELNCIKGGGACLFQEKLVALQAKEFIVVADYRKRQSRLLTAWPTIPIEVAPVAARRVLTQLRAIGSVNPKLRTISDKDGIEHASRSDQGFFIIDAPFAPLLTAGDVAAGKDGSGKDGIWEVEPLAHRINLIEGVLEVGLFYGRTGPEMQALYGDVGGPCGQKPVAAYFGMEDGSCSERRAE